jgi:uncharacterized membrane protein
VRPHPAAGGTLPVLLLLAACGPPESPPPPPPVEPPAAAPPAPPQEVGGSQSPAELPGAGSTAFRCAEDLGFVLRVRGDSAELHLIDAVVALRRAESAPETRWVGAGAELRVRGAEALLELRGSTLSGCRSDGESAPWAAAGERGVHLRAVGQEPGWHLEITHGRELVFVGDYGETTVSLPAPRPERVGAGEVEWLAVHGDRRVRVLARDEPCFDIMSGEPYELAVLVEREETRYTGCGRVLNR